jgi:hypothetical protein
MDLGIEIKAPAIYNKKVASGRHRGDRLRPSRQLTASFDRQFLECQEKNSIHEVGAILETNRNAWRLFDRPGHMPW